MVCIWLDLVWIRVECTEVQGYTDMVWLRRVATLLCHMLGIGGNTNDGRVSPYASQIIDLIGRLLACRFPMVTVLRLACSSRVNVPAQDQAWPQPQLPSQANM